MRKECPMTFMEKIRYIILGMLAKHYYEKIRRLDEKLARTTAALHPRIVQLAKKRERLEEKERLTKGRKGA